MEPEASVLPHGARRMWRGRPRLPVLLLFALVALGLLGSFVLILNTIRDERADRVQLARMNDVMADLREISRAMTDAETGQRGYFITGDTRYLRPFVAARETYRPAIARLRTEIEAAPLGGQRDLLDDIARLSNAKFGELEDTVGLIQRGDKAEALRRILTDEGKDVMDRLRYALGAFEAIERGEMERLRSQTQASEARLFPFLGLLLVLIVASLALGLWQVLRAAEAEAQAAQAGMLAAARDRADLLARELNHRVKNLFAVVLAIVRMSGRDSPEAGPAIDRIAARIEALLKAHEVTQGASQHRVAQLTDLVETALAPYRSERNDCAISGPQVLLPEAQVVPIGLVLHELVTNAVKYGAWCEAGGRIDVSWSLDDATPQTLTVDWHEHCAAPCAKPDDKQGFGSLLVESSARQLQGRFERDYFPSGIRLRLAFPLTTPT